MNLVAFEKNAAKLGIKNFPKNKIEMFQKKKISFDLHYATRLVTVSMIACIKFYVRRKFLLLIVSSF